MPNVSYDTLSIKIEADSKQANASIKNLSTNLRTLDTTAKELDTDRLIEVRGLLQSIAKIDFSNVTKGLQSVVSAFKALTAKANSKSAGGIGGGLENAYPTGQNFELVGDSYSKGFTMLKQELVAVNNSLGETHTQFERLNFEVDLYKKNFDEAFGGEETQKAENVKTTIDDITQKLREAGFTEEQISAVTRSIRKEMSLFNDSEIEALRGTLLNLGINADQVDKYIKNLKRDMDNLNNGVNRGKNGFSKLINQFAKIAKYRIIRKIIQELYKALTEGIKNIIEFDEQTSATINSLKSKFAFVKNALGAMIAPLINLVAPLLNTISKVVGEIGNQLAEMFAGFNGQEQFVKATDAVEDFNDELKKSKGLGIDELNVIQKEESTGSFEYSQVNSLVGTTNVFNDVIAGLVDIINETLPVIKLFVDSVGILLNALGTLIKAIMPILEVVITLLNAIINYVGILVNEVLGAVIRVIAKVIEIIGEFFKFIKPIIDAVITVIDFVIDIVTDLVDLIADLIIDALQPILDVIKVILNFLTPLLRLAMNLFQGFINVIRNIIKVIVDIAGGVLKTISDLLCGIAPLLEGILNALGFKWLDKTPAWARAVIGVLTGGGSELLHLLTSGHFATGGFPEDGFFYANHNELVGQFSNGQTAVANNAQIVEGIKQGVLEAMLQANRTDKQIIIQIDGKEVAKAVNRQNANSGYTGINGGYKYGY